MASNYTDEDLYMHYRPYSADTDTAQRIVAEHRSLYPLPDATRSGDWTGTTQVDRDRAVLEALKRAASTSDESEKQALIDHALGGARVREAAAVKVSR